MSVSILFNPNVKYIEELKLNCNELNCIIFNADNIISDEVKTINLSCDTLFQKQAYAELQSIGGVPLLLASQNTFYSIIGIPTLKLPDNNIFVYNNTPGKTSQYGILPDGQYIIETYVLGINGPSISTLSCSCVINNDIPDGSKDSISYIYSIPANEPFSFFNNDIKFINAGTLIDIVMACRSQNNITVSINRWYIRLTKIG